MHKTLFSRMLATYLSVMLLILILLGITVSSVFQNQYLSEKESGLRREVEEINEIILSEYLDDDKRPSATDKLRVRARQHDALIQLYFADAKYGRVVFLDEEFKSKWGTATDYDFSAEAAAIVNGANPGELTTSQLMGIVDIPVMSLSNPIMAEDGTIIGTLFFHTDMSNTNNSIKQVFLDVLLSSLIAVILAFFAVSYITARMSKPILDMNSAVTRFSKGEYTARVQISSADEVGQLGSSFNDMADAINNLEQVRRSFVANVSHELRSPLASMRGFLEAMRDGTISQEDYNKYLDIVIGENNRMGEMVNDLLDLARIESGQYVLNTEPFDINELIIRTMLTFEARINAKHIDVRMDFEDEHTMVMADSGQIAQVLRNLIDNAIKFSPDASMLVLSTAKDKQLVQITVRDNGAGIAKEDLPYVFDRFYKAEKAHTPSGSSTGLGLSIVERIIEQHGQSIRAESPEGGGTAFIFTLQTYAKPVTKGKSATAQRKERI